ncbi:major facilitator superfamily protein [Tolypothrix sp. NIES-4075]|uniref:hypothetical protein n=1 Tax=Tolypothrix sp. NIES-4075 TaxID=2005459 RepID=UPI000B5C79E9|nr:major facilitator superfamily protein [Tolypothrix sp. NIES-4075]
MSSSDRQLKKHLKASAVKQDAFAALRIRDYRLFIIGRVLLFTGFQIRNIAVGWELYSVEGFNGRICRAIYCHCHYKC